MTRIFAYCRVSTTEQNTENQVLAIKIPGYDVQEQRVLVEKISGSSATAQRPIFNKLLERLESGDTLVVVRLDRLGRDMSDCTNTLKLLKERGISVVSLDQGAIDLNSATGTLIVNVLLSVAQMERDLIIERTNAGLARAKENGVKLGRKAGSKYTSEIQELQNQGLTQKQIEVRLGISRSTVKRNWVK